MSDTRDRAFWLLVYRGLQLICKAIKDRYLSDGTPAVDDIAYHPTVTVGTFGAWKE